MGEKSAAAIFLLMIFAPLRFADTKDVSNMWLTDTAVCGVSLDHKNHAGALMQWATPRCGIKSEGWVKPLFRYWEWVKPTQEPKASELKFRFLSSLSIKLGR